MEAAVREPRGRIHIPGRVKNTLPAAYVHNTGLAWQRHGALLYLSHELQQKPTNCMPRQHHSDLVVFDFFQAPLPIVVVCRCRRTFVSIWRGVALPLALSLLPVRSTCVLAVVAGHWFGGTSPASSGGRRQDADRDAADSGRARRRLLHVGVFRPSTVNTSLATDDLACLTRSTDIRTHQCTYDSRTCIAMSNRPPST